jgi:cystathionine beta-lyase/cystathionine gamma-synthase
VRLEELTRKASLVGPRTKVVWFESPINPTLRCVDVAAVAGLCREAGVLSVLDNTFASPVNQRPAALGVDLIMHSATKYLNGHSDVTAGVIAGPARLVEPVARARRLLGGVLDPHAAYALGRGLKTLALRVARHNDQAMAVARWLEGDARVARVFYPGLESHPDHRIARAQMTGFGGMVCLELDGGLAQASRFFDRLQVFRRAASLGGVESLCSLPVLTSHWGHSEEQLRQAGVTAGMARLSVGLEEVEDLIADLDQALE